MQKQIKYLLQLMAASFVFWIFSSSAYATDYVWPGAAPANSTLQYCINNVASGDTIKIAISTVDESLTIDKSLTLTPAPGYSPRFVNAHSIVASSTGVTDNAITIEGLTLEYGVFIVTHTSTGTFTLNLLDNTIEEGFTTGPAIRFWPINGGATYFNISSNIMTVPIDSQAHGIQVHANTNIEGSINNNVIIMEGSTQGSAIEVTNLGAPNAAVNIVGNKISGTNMDNGIFIYQYTPGCTTDTTIANNLITGQAGNTGGPGALVYYVTNGTVNLQVVNNTVADNEEGLILYCDPGTAMGNIANNIVANNSSAGLFIDTDVAGTVTNNHNLVYNNSANGFTPGTGTLYENPSFAGADDYRLRPGSAAINSGDNDSIPSGITTDLAGHPRIIRSIVDIGAYEQRCNITSVLLPLLLY